MKINKKILIGSGFIILLAIFIFSFYSVTEPETGEKRDVEITKYNEDGQLIIYYFYDRNCPVCEQQENFLNEIEEKYEEDIELKSFEVRTNENIRLFQEIGKVYGITPRGVPTTFIGDNYWIGFHSNYEGSMESKIEKCIETIC